MSDQRRHREDAGPELRALLEAAKEDEPTAEELEQIRASLPERSSDHRLRLSVGGSVLMVLTLVAVWRWRGDDVTNEPAPPPLTPYTVPTELQPTELQPTELQPTEPAPVPVAPAPEPAPPSSRATKVPKPAPAPTPPSELELISRAYQALRGGELAAAAALAEQHRRHFEHGALAQEREVILIETAVQGGDLDGGRARFETFARQYPRSGHLVRLRSLLTNDRDQ